MSDAKLPGGPVVLPWAHPAFDPDANQSIEAQHIAEEARRIEVHPDGMDVREAPEPVSDLDAGRRRRRSALPPELLARGLPYEPWPSVPEEDREPLDVEALLGGAVAIDVLTTRSKTVTAGPTILSDLTEILVAVGAEGGHEHLGELVELAASAVGASRERLRERWSNAESADPLLLPQSTPAAVSQALRRLEAGGEAVIREACLLLDALSSTRYTAG
ncbi:MAG: hypothetical protein AAF654_14125 [Myxococcota bacterium]